MSRYSGKCDLADTVEMQGEKILNAKIYLPYANRPLLINDMKDLIQYYPYLIASACFDNVEGRSIIQLTSESWVDTAERRSLTFELQLLIKIYNRCKRKKIEFDVDSAVNEICFGNFKREQITELAQRVKLNGSKATIDGIHLPVHERYRRELVDEMLRNGLNPANYGYERFV